MTDDPRAIELKLEATRSHLADTIDRIKDKLTLTGMVDEVMGQAGMPRYENGPDMLMGLLRRHPVPVMIAAAGLGFLVYRRNRDRRASVPAIHDAEYVEVPARVDGQARAYDPDAGSRPVSSVLPESNRAIEVQA